MLGLKLVRTIIMLHITIAAAAGLVSGLGGWTLLRTTESPKSPPTWTSSRNALTAVSLGVVIISVTGVVGSARRSRNWLCCYMISTLALLVSQVTFAGLLLNQLPEPVMRRRPVNGDIGIISAAERAEGQFWEQLFDAQYISCYCAFAGAALMFGNVLLTLMLQMRDFKQSGKKIPASVGGMMVPRKMVTFFNAQDTVCMISESNSPMGSPRSPTSQSSERSSPLSNCDDNDGYFPEASPIDQCPTQVEHDEAALILTPTLQSDQEVTVII